MRYREMVRLMVVGHVQKVWEAMMYTQTSMGVGKIFPGSNDGVGQVVTKRICQEWASSAEISFKYQLETKRLTFFC